MFLFVAWILTKNIFKNRLCCLIGMRKSFQLIFVWMLYKKTDQIIHTQAEKLVCVHESKNRNRTLVLNEMYAPATVTKLWQLLLWIFIIK